VLGNSLINGVYWGYRCRNANEATPLEWEAADYTLGLVPWALAKQNLCLDSSPHRILEAALASSCDWLVLQSAGHCIFPDFLAWLESVVEQDHAFPLWGHLIDEGDGTFSLHPQCAVISLKVLRHRGLNEWRGTTSFFEMARSQENVHGNHTPVSLRQKSMRAVRADGPGSKLLYDFLSRGYEAKNFPLAARAGKIHLYPNKPEQFEEKKVKLQEKLSLSLPLDLSPATADSQCKAGQRIDLKKAGNSLSWHLTKENITRALKENENSILCFGSYFSTLRPGAARFSEREQEYKSFLLNMANSFPDLMIAGLSPSADPVRERAGRIGMGHFSQRINCYKFLSPLEPEFSKIAGALPIKENGAPAAINRHQTTVPYVRLNIEVPKEAMLEEARELWSAGKFFPYRSVREDHRGWFSLCLFGYSDREVFSLAYKNQPDLRSGWTPSGTLCPVIQDFCQRLDLFEQFDHVRLMALVPGGTIRMHRDYPVPKLADVNISLNTPPGCSFLLDPPGILPYQSGDAFLLNLNYEHCLTNYGAEVRFHLLPSGKISEANLALHLLSARPPSDEQRAH
jgi:hypothetical protein